MCAQKANKGLFDTSRASVACVLSHMTGSTHASRCAPPANDVSVLCPYSDMSENKLATIPPCIGEMTSLNRLDLHSNNIASLPEEIGNLTQV